MNSYNISPKTIVFYTGMEASTILPKFNYKEKTTVPRHPKLDKQLCDLICKQLEIAKL